MSRDGNALQGGKWHVKPVFERQKQDSYMEEVHMPYQERVRSREVKLDKGVG